MTRLIGLRPQAFSVASGRGPARFTLRLTGAGAGARRVTSGWRARLTARLCRFGAEWVLNTAKVLRDHGLLRTRDANRAFACAAWLAQRGLRAWRRDAFSRGK